MTTETKIATKKSINDLSPEEKRILLKLLKNETGQQSFFSRCKNFFLTLVGKNKKSSNTKTADDKTARCCVCGKIFPKISMEKGIIRDLDTRKTGIEYTCRSCVAAQIEASHKEKDDLDGFGL